MSQLKHMVKEAMRMIAARVSDAEYKAIEQKAKKYADGNVSEWIRYAAVNMEPKKDDLT